MKVYSWNVFCFNTKFDEMRDFIRALDFDVLCLQEVTPELLEYIKELPFELAYHIDVIRLFSRTERQLNYVAILSRYPIAMRGTLQFPDFKFPYHTRIFIRLMRAFHLSFITERGVIYADIDIGGKDGKKIRIFSVHLTLWGPKNRAIEFDLVTKHLPKVGPAIIAGDFNVIEFGPMKILNWLLGSKVSEATPWYPERDLFEKRFIANKFQNPLRGKTTHDFSRSQLDHILVSDGLAVKDAWVHTDLHGSDHYPVAVEIAL
jgi:endonuclease/exonuclease/phosphatase family metal-dependent hydrolase